MHLPHAQQCTFHFHDDSQATYEDQHRTDGYLQRCWMSKTQTQPFPFRVGGQRVEIWAIVSEKRVTSDLLCTSLLTPRRLFCLQLGRKTSAPRWWLLFLKTLLVIRWRSMSPYQKRKVCLTSEGRVKRVSLIFVFFKMFYPYLQSFASNLGHESKQQLFSFFLFFLEMLLTDFVLFVLPGGCREVKLIKQERNWK